MAVFALRLPLAGGQLAESDVHGCGAAVGPGQSDGDGLAGVEPGERVAKVWAPGIAVPLTAVITSPAVMPACLLARVRSTSRCSCSRSYKSSSYRPSGVISRTPSIFRREPGRQQPGQIPASSSRRRENVIGLAGPRTARIRPCASSGSEAVPRAAGPVIAAAMGPRLAGAGRERDRLPAVAGAADEVLARAQA